MAPTVFAFGSRLPKAKPDSHQHGDDNIVSPYKTILTLPQNASGFVKKSTKFLESEKPCNKTVKQSAKVVSRTNRHGPINDLEHLMEKLRHQVKTEQVDFCGDKTFAGENGTTNEADSKSSDAVLHLMKVKLRMQDSDIDNATKDASERIQDFEKMRSEIEQVTRNIKNLKAYERHQEQKIQTFIKQTNESKKMAERFTKESERLQRELNAMVTKSDEARDKVMPEAQSVYRLATLNDNVKTEVQQIKEENKGLQEACRKRQQLLQDNKRRHKQELKRFVNLVHKRNNFTELLKKHRDHLESSQIFKYTEQEFRSYFQSSPDHINYN